MLQYTDRAIENLSDDKLGRKNFAREIAKRIIAHEDPASVVYGIYGDWGTGKTSIINMVEKVLVSENENSENRPVVIRFNPWLFSDQGALVSSFFDEISAQFGKKDLSGKLKKLSEALASMSKMTKPLAWIPAIGRHAELVSDALKSSSSIVDCIAEHIESDLVSKKEEIARLLIDTQQRVVIIIDDIDRLTVIEIRQVFQLVKSLADFPFVIYLLAFDDAVVCQALDKPSSGRGREYLEKIIQVSLPIPATPRHKLRKIVGDYLYKMLSERKNDTWDDSYWRMVDFVGFWSPFRTMRDCYRYINALDFSYGVLRDEINLVDLWCLTLLQVFYPQTYTWVRNNKAFLTQNLDYTFKTGSSINQKENKIRAEAYFQGAESTVPENEREAVSELIQHMFPSIGHLLGRVGMSVSGVSMRASKRIGADENFDRYFRFGLDDDEISAAEFASFMESTDNMTSLTEQLVTLKEKAPDLFDRIEDRLSEFNAIRAKNIIQVLCTIGDDFIEQEEIIGGVSGSILRITRNLLRDEISASDRMQVLNACLIEWSHGMIVISLLLRALEWEHDPQSGGYLDDARKRTLSESDIQTIKEKIKQCIEKGEKSGELQKYKFRLKLINYWNFALDSHEQARTVVQEMCRKDEGCLSFLKENTRIMAGIQGVLQYFNREALSPRLIKLRQDLVKRKASADEIELVDSYIKGLKEE